MEEMKRQGLIITIEQLKKLIKVLEHDSEEYLGALNLTRTKNEEKSKWQINIINKKGQSDTWELE